ncbi:MBOAT family protein [Lachnospiraceae bacterium NSJ-143]|nr:MBOAT family protein [Lachnospiraceae bacterium NSJ-143]
MLLFASYIFYMCWNPALIVIIVFITFINFVAAALIYSDSQKSRRNLYLSLCMLINFGTLFVFKYLDFACGALNSVLSAFNAGFSVTPPEIVLPMGISFYTFQAAAYTIDVYRGELKPSRSYVRFSLFITFFPQLVAGPIERSRNLIRQFDSKNRFRMRNVLTGLEMMTVGFFKKVVIADRIAVGVNTVFNNPGSYSGLYYILAVFMFTVQIYCDFSGYSDIARGAAKVLGFRLMVNFDRPFGSATLKEFWRRWHISLSTWFMDYIYIPLGGNRKGRLVKYRNLFITFMVSGLWHGAAYTFVIWGALHGVYLIIEDIIRTEYRKITDLYGSIKTVDILAKITAPFITFGFVMFAFIFFRANSFGDALHIYSRLFWDFRQWDTAQYIYQMLTSFGLSLYELKILLIAVVTLFVSELLAGHDISGYMRGKGIVVEVLYYSFILIFILTAGVFYNAGEFIYFQF